MKSATKHIVISTILCALTLVVFLAFYNRLPASIPVHFDSAGVANSFWPRNVVVFGVPVACVLLNLISGFTRDEKSRTFSSNSQRSHILRTSSRSIRLILSSIVSFAVWLKWTRTI